MVGGCRPFHPSVPWSILSSIRPSIHLRQRGGKGGRGPFLNCKTPLFQGIAHFALFIACYEGVLAHNRNFSQALRKVQYAISVANFYFFWVLGWGGKGDFFSFFYWGWGLCGKHMKCCNQQLLFPSFFKFLSSSLLLPRGITMASSVVGQQEELSLE